MTRPTTVLALVCVLVTGVAAVGCDRAYLRDDIDLEFDLDPLFIHSGSIHEPYVVGTSVRISVGNRYDNGDDPHAWSLESSDESILQIESQESGSARCIAVGVGQTTLRVFDEDGDRIHSQTIEVRAPDRVELYAHGPLIIDTGEEEALTDGDVRVLAGGMATFLVRYFDGATRLFGNGVLVASCQATPDDIDLYEQSSFFFENREWLQITPNFEGTYVVDLAAGEHPVGSISVEGVSAAIIDRIELLGENESGADDGEWLAVLAEAYGTNGETIYGVEYSWDVDSNHAGGEGDLYRYEYDEDDEVDLAANFDGHRAEATIHSGQGYVSSTNTIGCTAAPATPGRGATLPAMTLSILVLAGLTWRRRRSH